MRGRKNRPDHGGPVGSGGRGKPPSVILVSNSPSLGSLLLGSEVVRVTAKVDGLDFLRALAVAQHPDALVLDVGVMGEKGCGELLSYIAALYPRSRILAVAGPDCSAGEETARKLEACGARFIRTGEEGWQSVLVELGLMFSATGSPAAAFPREMPDPVEQGGQSLPAETEPADREDAVGRRQGQGAQTIVLFNAKGGVGKTFVAVNLAVGLSNRVRSGVILVDLDLYCGDVGVHLDLAGNPTMSDLVPYLPDVEDGTIRGFVARHRPSGLDVLLSPAQPELSELVTVEHVRAMLTRLGTMYRYIVLDTGGATSDIVRDCLERAWRIVLVTTADAASLKSAKVTLEVLRRLGIDVDRKVMLVLNRAHASSPVGGEGIEGFLGKKLTVTIPDDRPLVESSIFEGRPALLKDRGSPVSRALLSLVDLFFPAEQEPYRVPSRGLRAILKKVVR